MSLDFDLIAKDEDGNEIQVLSLNYTHNVTDMWIKADVYNSLYMSNGLHGRDVINKIEVGLKHMNEHQAEYELLNPSNGWGDYNGAWVFLKEILDGCKQYPSARIEISK